MTDFDAIVVGSGISGGWSAMELTKKGLKVLMIERGRMVRHGEDYVTEHRAPWEFPFHQYGDQQRYQKRYPVQSRASIFGEATEHFFVDDVDSPYQSEGDFTWFRGDQLGGRSLTWGRHVFRYSDLDLSANKRDGHGVDWPIRYADLAPWYDKVEEFIGVSGSAAGLDHMPDGKFMPPLPLNCVEEHLGTVLKSQFDRHVLPARVAVLTEEREGRSPCHFCGPCVRGCSTGSYFSTQSSTLPAAIATGLLTIMTDALVDSLEYDAKSKRITGLHVIDRNTGTRSTQRAKIVFLNASTIATTQILLNSRSDAMPNGLANSSGEVGRNLMDHIIGPNVTGQFAAFADRTSVGNRPAGIGIVIPRYRNVASEDSPFMRGYHFQGNATRQNWTRMTNSPGIGTEMKTELARPGPWTMFIGGVGECLPSGQNRVTLDPKKTDKWGVPQAHIHFAWSDNERRIAEDIASEGVKMLAAAGATNIKSANSLAPGGTAIHEAGTARMGHDPATSVLNGYNQAHDIANLFITDGSCLTSSPNQNPSLTYMALSARAADYAVTLLKQAKL